MKNSTCYAGRGMELGGFFFIKHSMLGEIIFDLFKNELSGRAQSPTQIFMSKLSDSLHARICMQFQLICCLSANFLKNLPIILHFLNFLFKQNIPLKFLKMPHEYSCQESQFIY